MGQWQVKGKSPGNSNAKRGTSSTQVTFHFHYRPKNTAVISKPRPLYFPPFYYLSSLYISKLTYTEFKLISPDSLI